MEGKKSIVWFRNDLRLHDHQPLVEAVAKGGVIYPVYCLDTSLVKAGPGQRRRMGVFRLQFLLESLHALQEKLREKGAELIILSGNPEEEISRLAAEKGAGIVYAYKEVADEEVKQADRLETLLFKQRIVLQLYLGNTLYNKEDLPFPIPDVPDTFSLFKKRVEKDSSVRRSFPEPALIPGDSQVFSSRVPSLEDFGLAAPAFESRAAMHFKGGEEAGLARLQEYIWDKELIASYKKTRNGLIGADYSSKLSAWLSMGCLSPRKVYEEIKAYENDRVANNSTQWLFLELLWRDYFRFVFKKYGVRLFQERGIREEGPAYVAETEQQHFELWKNGQTGIPFIDAGMIELRESGFMSNRGRQVVAAFLVHDLKVRWRLGAAWFEENLVDYNPASNWGNWAYVAGVGNDPRENRYFNVLKQAYDYDPKGEYVAHWIEVLAKLPPYLIHQPWTMSGNQSELYGVEVGNNYPPPIVEFKKFEKQY